MGKRLIPINGKSLRRSLKSVAQTVADNPNSVVCLAIQNRRYTEVYMISIGGNDKIGFAMYKALMYMIPTYESRFRGYSIPNKFYTPVSISGSIVGEIMPDWQSAISSCQACQTFLAGTELAEDIVKAINRNIYTRKSYQHSDTGGHPVREFIEHLRKFYRS